MDTTQKKDIGKLAQARDEALRELISESNNSQRFEYMISKKLDAVQDAPTKEQADRAMVELADLEQQRQNAIVRNEQAQQLYSDRQAELSRALVTASPQAKKYADEESLERRAKIYLQQGGKSCVPSSVEKMKEVLVFMDHHQQSPGSVRDFVYGTDFNKPIEIHWDEGRELHKLKHATTNLPSGSRLLKYESAGSSPPRLDRGYCYTTRGTSSYNLGINPEGRWAVSYQTDRNIACIRSTAAHVSDRFSVFGQRFPAAGRGAQFFIPGKFTLSVRPESPTMHPPKLSSKKAKKLRM